MRRFIVIVLLLLPLLGITWGWRPLPAATGRVQITSLNANVSREDREALGPFVLEQLWRLSSTDRRFGGYSALITEPTGQLLAVSDRNGWLRFAAPTREETIKLPMGRNFLHRASKIEREYFDTESAVRDPQDGSLWIGLEDEWHVARIAKLGQPGRFYGIPALRDWPDNGGAEAMTRLPDGRWVMLCETCGGGRGGLHLGLIFAGHPGRSPLQKFGILLPPGFDPVDMVPLPDGRLMILTRGLGLFPPHFASRIVLADFAKLDPKHPLPTQEIARIEGSGVRENYEGMATRADDDGHLTVWLISDANDSLFQQTRLMQLRLDPAKLPRAR